MSLGQGRGAGWQPCDDTYICILLYYTDINWLLLTASAIMSASVISLHNRGGGSTISFLHHTKIKKVIFGLCPKPSTANFMQRNLLLFSRHLPCLLLRVITLYLNFEFTPTLWPFFARFSITSRHLWTIIIVDHELYHCAHV